MLIEPIVMGGAIALVMATAPHDPLTSRSLSLDRVASCAPTEPFPSPTPTPTSAPTPPAN
ncbi:MAG TPA: hypothetical protein V6C88_18390 [Chroococcidiopsis sp.]